MNTKEKCPIEDFDRKALQRIVNLLNEAATLADGMELTLGNGAFVGSLAGGMADELEFRLKGARQ